jgi:hypothetical protein
VVVVVVGAVLVVVVVGAVVGGGADWHTAMVTVVPGFTCVPEPGFWLTTEPPGTPVAQVPPDVVLGARPAWVRAPWAADCG